LSTIATPPLNTATTLFNEHRSQRPFGTLIDKTYSPRLAWFHGFRNMVSCIPTKTWMWTSSGYQLPSILSKGEGVKLSKG